MKDLLQRTEIPKGLTYIFVKVTADICLAKNLPAMFLGWVCPHISSQDCKEKTVLYAKHIFLALLWQVLKVKEKSHFVHSWWN